MSFGWRIAHALPKHLFGSGREFVRGRTRIGAGHVLKYLKQAPAATAVALCCQGTFAFEVYVIDERITALFTAGQARELMLHLLRLARLRDHLRERSLESRDEELGLLV